MAGLIRSVADLGWCKKLNHRAWGRDERMMQGVRRQLISNGIERSRDRRRRRSKKQKHKRGGVSPLRFGRMKAE